MTQQEQEERTLEPETSTSTTKEYSKGADSHISTILRPTEVITSQSIRPIRTAAPALLMNSTDMSIELKEATLEAPIEEGMSNSMELSKHESAAAALAALQANPKAPTGPMATTTGTELVSNQASSSKANKLEGLDRSKEDRITNKSISGTPSATALARSSLQEASVKAGTNAASEDTQLVFNQANSSGANQPKGLDRSEDQMEDTTQGLSKECCKQCDYKRNPTSRRAQ